MLFFTWITLFLDPVTKAPLNWICNNQQATRQILKNRTSTWQEPKIKQVGWNCFEWAITHLKGNSFKAAI
nr:hypothetical protein CFP56_34498 [Quercus suber]